MRVLAVIVSLTATVLAAVLLNPGAFGDTLKPSKVPGDGAVLRVIAPPGKHYEVRWGAWWQFWREHGSFVAKVGKGHWANDRPVKPTGDGVYEFTMSKVVSKGGDYEEPSSAWKGDLSAILYVDGEVATCAGSQDAPLHLEWHKKDGAGHLLTRIWCSRYTRAESAPDHHSKGGPAVLLSVGGILALPVLLLLLFALVSGRRAEPIAGEEPRRVEAGKKREDVRLAKKREEQRKDEEKRREEVRKRHLESQLRREEINRMSGVEFERFMADFFRQKGYGVQTTKASGDQGVDLLLDIEGKKVAVQLKRWAGTVGNAVVGATFAGMAHYGADEGWIITTSTFSKSARELAKSTRVRLIDGRELFRWLRGSSNQD